MTPALPDLLDSIAHIGPQHDGKVIVSGSHGGVSAGRFVVGEPRPPRAVFFNDAGVGKDDAGIAGIAMLDAAGVVGATYSHRSARIGDARDGYECGVITRVNRLAEAIGLTPGMSVREAVSRLG